MPPSVLIIDDEPEITQVLGDWIKDELEEVAPGCRVLKANTVNAAIEMIANNELNFILSDVRMPGGGGLKIAEKVKESGLTIPFYFLSGFSDISEEVMSTLPVKGVLKKPVNLRKLTQLIIDELNLNK